MEINTNEYLRLKDAVELSKRSEQAFLAHVTRGNIQFIEPWNSGRLYLKSDVLKLAKKQKQPNA